MTQQMPTSPTPRARAVRLTFEYEGQDVRLVEQQPVNVVAMAGDEPVDGPRSGSALEVRSVDGEVLHRRVLHQPMHSQVEVFSPEPGASIRRDPQVEERGTFTVLVPTPPGADHVALFTPPASSRRRGLSAAAATETRRFPLAVTT